MKRKLHLFYLFIKNLYCFKQYLKLRKAFKPFQDKGLLQFGPHNLYINGYIARTYTFKNRILIGTFHYNFLNFKFSVRSIDQVFDRGITCWQETINNENYSVLLKKECYEGEGSLSLLFQVNDLVLYFLRFSFGPDLNAIGNTVIYVGTIQGTRNINHIKKATENVDDIYPPKILITITESIARIFGIRTIVGVNSENQLASKKWADQNKIYFLYERFYESIGGMKSRNGCYFIPCPFPKRPITLINQKHRGRTLVKRKKLQEISTLSTELLTKGIMAIFSIYYHLPLD